MSKPATARQLETAQRELNNAVVAIVSTWRESNPYPSWEVENEWEKANPSPRARHAAIESEVGSRAKARTHDLMLKLQLGEVSSDCVYVELKQALYELNEVRLSYIERSN